MADIRRLDESNNIGNTSGARKLHESSDAFEKILAAKQESIGNQIPELFTDKSIVPAVNLMWDTISGPYEDRTTSP